MCVCVVGVRELAERHDCRYRALCRIDVIHMCAVTHNILSVLILLVMPTDGHELSNDSHTVNAAVGSLPFFARATRCFVHALILLFHGESWCSLCFEDRGFRLERYAVPPVCEEKHQRCTAVVRANLFGQICASRNSI